MKKNELLLKLATRKQKIGMKIEQNKPEILFGLGVVSFLATIVTASKATLDAEKVVAEHKRLENTIKEAYGDGEFEDYPKEKKDRETLVLYSKTAVNIGKHYVLPLALGSFSLFCFFAGKKIMKDRYVAVAGAYNSLLLLFKEYRKRVVEEEGELMDRHYYYGTELEDVKETETDENGKTKKVTKKQESLDVKKLPPIDTVYFTKGNKNWVGVPDLDLLFLRNAQEYFNKLLKAREDDQNNGWVTINEVRDYLGFAPVPHGGMVGWVTNSEYHDKSGIDFHIYDDQNVETLKFLNGDGYSIMLSFNHDGVIWDKIRKF